MAQKKSSNLDNFKKKKHNYSVKKIEKSSQEIEETNKDFDEENNQNKSEKVIKCDNKFVAHFQKYKLYYTPFLILILTLLAYYKAFDNDFVNWDDDRYVTLNPYITEFSWENIKYFFTNFYFVMYIPLAMISYMIDFQIAGLENPSIYHAHNILIHGINTVLVFVLVFMVIKKISKEKAFFFALISSLFFGIHPLHTESVTWIAERKDVLYTMYFLSSLIFYIFYIEKLKLKFYFLALFLFLLSLFSKTQAVVLSVSMVLIDYLIGRIDLSKNNVKRFFAEKRYFKEKVINEKIAFFFLSTVFGLLAVFAIGTEEPLAESFSTVKTTTNEANSLFENILYSCYSFSHYIIKLLVPQNLSAIHPYPTKIDNEIPLKFFLYPIPVLAIIAGLVWAFIKEKKYIVFSILFFTANIILVLQLASVQNFLLSEHYAYIPAIGISILLVYLHYKILNKNQKLKSVLNTFWILYISILTIFTFFRNDVWENSLTLWDNVKKQYPEVIVAHYNRGNYNQEQGDKALAEGKSDEALNYYLEAINDYDSTIILHSTNIGALSNRGITQAKIGNAQSAVADFYKVIEIDSTYGNVFSNLGNALVMLNKWDSAIINYTKAINFRPDFDDAYFNRGNAYATLGKYNEAVADYSFLISKSEKFNNLLIYRAYSYYVLQDYENSLADINLYLKYFQDNYKAYYYRALIYKIQDKEEEAKKDLETIGTMFPDGITEIIKEGEGYEQNGDYTGQLNYYNLALDKYNLALEINENNTSALVKIGVLYGKLNNLVQSIKYFNRCLEIDSLNFEALTNRGFAKDLSGDKSGAVKDYTKAISINSSATLAYFNRGIVYNSTGKYQLAFDDFSKAIEIQPDYAIAYLNRGISCLNLNKMTEACSDWTNSINLGFSNAQYYLNTYCK